MGVKNRAVHIDFRWQQIPRTVTPSTGATQAASLRKLVGVAPVQLEATDQIGLTPALHAGCMYDRNHAFLTFTALATHYVWSTTHRLWSRSKESTCTECSFCFHRSGLDGELHCEFADLQGVKKSLVTLLFCPVNRQKYIHISDSKKTLGYPDNTTLLLSGNRS